MSALNHSVEVDMSAVWRAVALNFARDLEAERAKLRRWQLRLRWRRDHRLDKLIDRLHYRARHHPAQNLRTGRPDWRHFSFPLTRFILAMLREPHSFPIAGPRGVLP